MAYSPEGIWIPDQYTSQSQSTSPMYSGAPPATNMPASSPTVTWGGGFQDGINAQEAYANTNYNVGTNNSLDIIYQQGLANWQQNEAANPGQNGPAPAAPYYTQTDYEKNLAWTKANTPGDPTYGQDVNFDYRPYQQQNYAGVIAPWTTANTNLNLNEQNKLPQVGKPSSPDNPYGLLPADAYKWATGREMPANGYGYYDQGYDPNVTDIPLAQRGYPNASVIGSPKGDGTGWWNPPTGTNVTGYAGSAAQQNAPTTNPKDWNYSTFYGNQGQQQTVYNPNPGGGTGTGGGGYTPYTPGGSQPGSTANPYTPGSGFNLNNTGPGSGYGGFGSAAGPSMQNWTPPWMQGGQSNGPGYSTADNFMADQTNDLGYLRGITEAAGYATDQTPAWQAMIAAQKKNQDHQAADLSEKFNTMGGRFSTAYGDAMGGFYNQATLDQNSLLGQMTMQSQEAARGRELQAAGQLGGFASQAGQQLSAQDYGSRMQQLQAGLQASMQAGNGSNQAAMLMAQLGASGAGQLMNGSMQGAQSMFGAENQAALNMVNNSNQAGMGMYNQQQAMAMAQMQYDAQLRGLSNNAANNLSQNWMQSLGLGNQLGQSEFGIDDYNLNRVYEEWLRTQPIYNPLLPYMFSSATAQPASYAPSFQPSAFSQIAGPISQLAGAASGFKP